MLAAYLELTYACMRVDYIVPGVCGARGSIRMHFMELVVRGRFDGRGGPPMERVEVGSLRQALLPENTGEPDETARCLEALGAGGSWC